MLKPEVRLKGIFVCKFARVHSTDENTCLYLDDPFPLFIISLAFYLFLSNILSVTELMPLSLQNTFQVRFVPKFCTTEKCSSLYSRNGKFPLCSKSFDWTFKLDIPCNSERTLFFIRFCKNNSHSTWRLTKRTFDILFSFDLRARGKSIERSASRQQKVLFKS